MSLLFEDRITSPRSGISVTTLLEHPLSGTLFGRSGLILWTDLDSMIATWAGCLARLPTILILSFNSIKSSSSSKKTQNLEPGAGPGNKPLREYKTISSFWLSIKMLSWTGYKQDSRDQMPSNVILYKKAALCLGYSISLSGCS